MSLGQSLNDPRSTSVNTRTVTVGLRYGSFCFLREYLPIQLFLAESREWLRTDIRIGRRTLESNNLSGHSAERKYVCYFRDL